MAPIFQYVLLRIIREQGARQRNSSEQLDCESEDVRDKRLLRIAAVAESEVQAPPDHPCEDVRNKRLLRIAAVMELMLINATKVLIHGRGLIPGREMPGAVMTTGSRFRVGDCNCCTC